MTGTVNPFGGETNPIPGVFTTVIAGDEFELSQTGNNVTVDVNSVTVNSGPLAPATFPASEFLGSQPKLGDTGPKTGEAVWIGRACNGDTILNAGAIDSGDVAIVRRSAGVCTFHEKLVNAAAAGAAAIVVANQYPVTTRTWTTVAGAEYTIDGGANWWTMAATDGSFDQPMENVRATTGPGPWTAGATLWACVRGIDAAGNTGTPVCAQQTFDDTGPAVTAMSVRSPVAIGADLNLTATVSDVGFGSSGVAAAFYRIDGGAPHAMVPTAPPVASATEAFAAHPTIGSVGSHVVCVRGVDAFGNLGPPNCSTVKVYDEYGSISGNYKLNPKKAPTYTYNGFVAKAGVEIIGSISVTYKTNQVKTTCAFSLGAGSWSLVDNDTLTLTGWSRSCANGSGGTATLTLKDVAVAGPNGAIQVDDAINTYDIAAAGPAPLGLSNGSVQVADLTP